MTVCICTLVTAVAGFVSPRRPVTSAVLALASAYALRVVTEATALLAASP